MDPVVRKHFNSLSERMLEKDLCRIIEPYSYVQIEHIASSIGIDREKVRDVFFYVCGSRADSAAARNRTFGFE